MNTPSRGQDAMTSQRHRAADGRYVVVRGAGSAGVLPAISAYLANAEVTYTCPASGSAYRTRPHQRA